MFKGDPASLELGFFLPFCSAMFSAWPVEGVVTSGFGPLRLRNMSRTSTSRR